MCNFWKNGSHLNTCVTVGKMGLTKKCVTVEKMGHT